MNVWLSGYKHCKYETIKGNKQVSVTHIETRVKLLSLSLKRKV